MVVCDGCDYFSALCTSLRKARRIFRILNNMATSLPRSTEGTQSLRRAVGLLRALSSRVATGWRMSDLAEETGLDHTTVHRLLTGLTEERLVTRVPGTRRYTLGALAFELGVAAAPHFSLDVLAGAGLARLASETRDIVFLNVRSGFESVCIARYEGRKALKAYTVDVGTRRPLALSAGGVAMLVRMPRTEQAVIEAQNLGSIMRRGEARQTAVRKMLQRSNRLGYGLNLEDIIPGIAALGVAVCLPSGEPVASISLAAAGVDLAEPRRGLLLQRLRKEAAAIEALLPPLRYG
jgi:DNA-binding IclR family transcriptional regulator